MEQIPIYLRTGFDRSLALFRLLINLFVDNVFIAIEHFDEKKEGIYTASFGDERDILSSSHGGFCLNGTESITKQMSYEGVLLTGAIGSGKGATVVIPNMLLCTDNKTIIVHDPSGETTEKTSGFNSRNHRIVVYNFGKPDRSHSYNPLDYAKTKSGQYKLATILVHAVYEKNPSDPFWVLQSVTVIYCFVAIVMTQEPLYRNLKNVKNLIAEFIINSEKIDQLFIKYADDELMREYQSILTMDDKVMRSVVASCLSALGLWYDENVCRTTASSSIDLTTLRIVPTVIYIQGDTTNSRLYAPLIEIFFEQLMGIFFAKLPDPKDLDVAFIFDEASTLLLKSLNSYLNNARKHRLMFLLAFQSNQIDAMYGSEASSIKSALRTKVWLGGAGLDTSKELEDLLGRTEITDNQGKTKIKPLMLAEEIRAMRTDEGIIVSPAGKPYKTKMSSYFRSPFLNLKTKIAPFKFMNHRVPSVIPLIPLPNEKTKKK
jgi:type IV secretory pathway TraG/TraD family ATPase VirD4